MADATQLLAQADRAFVDEDYTDAVALYTKALEVAPTARIYDSRAQAHIKLENYLEAVEDASKAIELEPGLAKAYLKKGIASFKLEEYEAALACFQEGARLAPENTQFATWTRKCQAELEEELGSGADATPSKKPHIQASTTSPTSVLPPAAVQSAPPAAQPAPSAPAPAAAAPAPAAAPAAAAPAAASEAPSAAAAASGPSSSAAGEAPLAPAAPAVFAGKYRHQFYQMQSKVTVDVYAKNLAKEQVHVEFAEQHLTITITEQGTGAEDFKLDVQLYGKVVPGQSRYEVLRSKVEITMTKQDNVAWPQLEYSPKAAAVASGFSNPTAPPVAGQYPSSYVKKPKDWSKLESEVKEMEQKGELQDGDPLNDFFKKIFKDGDEDQRRAMIKSFVESNGTVLSTNWKEVGTKTVECSPPEGMQVNKWEA